MIEEQEIWKPINEWELLYSVSNFGRVKSLYKTVFSKRWPSGRIFPETILKENIRSNGYAYICLCEKERRKVFSIHRIVALHFLTPILGKDGGQPYRRHKNK